MKGSVKLLFGAIGLMAAGVTIGLLVAPQKGAKLRKQIRRKTGDWMETAKNAIQSKSKSYMEDVEEQSPAVVPVM